MPLYEVRSAMRFIRASVVTQRENDLRPRGLGRSVATQESALPRDESRDDEPRSPGVFSVCRTIQVNEPNELPFSRDESTYRLLEAYGLLGKRISHQDDAWFFSVSRYKKLLRRLGVDDLPDGSGLVEHVRRVKSPREIDAIREAGRYCQASVAAAIE